MKKSALRQIIREEIQNVLLELETGRAKGFNANDRVIHKGKPGRIVKFQFGTVKGKSGTWARIEHDDGTTHWVNMDDDAKSLQKE
jgi:hypothetical protein